MHTSSVPDMRQIHIKQRKLTSGCPFYPAASTASPQVPADANLLFCQDTVPQLPAQCPTTAPRALSPSLEVLEVRHLGRGLLCITCVLHSAREGALL